MATILGTQEFMAAHKDHILTIAVTSICQTVSNVEIEKFNNDHLYAVVGEVESHEILEDYAAYLYCRACDIEEEINLGEVVDLD